MKKILLYVLLLGLTGCASITNDTTHPMKVDTITRDGQSVTGAECIFLNDYGSSTGKSGGTALVRRSSKNLDITCTAAGREAASGVAISRANAGMVGNIIFGGAIGAVIDHNKGTAYTYPTWIRLVFGQARTYDRKDEKEGTLLAGKQNAPVLADAAVAKPSAPVSAAQSAVSAPIISLSGAPQPAFIASGYARIDDVDAVPYLGDRGRSMYREWLSKPTPRAFAVSSNGHFASTWSLKPSDQTLPSDPSERALLLCERGAKQACKLYAVNGAVVWLKEPAKVSVTGAGSGTPVAP